MNLKKTALCFALCLALICFCDLVLPRGESEIYDSVIRLHIIANSDSAADQETKLAVRDALLEAQVFDGSNSMDEAKQSLDGALVKAQAVANAVLAERGEEYGAKCLFGRESYPTRIYEGVKLPAGTYLSVRVVLGEGEGQNWWCVLFPPLCLGAASRPLQSDDGKVFTEDRYVFRFKLLEFFFS